MCIAKRQNIALKNLFSNADSDYAEDQHENEDIESFKKRIEANQGALDAANQVDIENGQAWHQRASFNCYHCQTNITSVEAASIHMTTQHSENLNPDTNVCILCPKELPSLTALVTFSILI